jgi:hypothetical protein
MTIFKNRSALVSMCAVLRLAVFTTAAATLAQPTAQAASRSADPRAEVPRQHVTQSQKDLMKMSENKTSPAGSAEMAAAKTLTTRALAIGTWTANATPETIPRSCRLRRATRCA